MKCDVLVVGAGPSGLTVASELALAGLSVTVLERRAGAVESRAGTILPRVLEMLDSRGLADAFIAKARAIRPDPLFSTHIWGGMQPVHLGTLGARYGFKLVLPQNFTEELLELHALNLGVSIEREVMVESVEQDDREVRVTTSTPGGERIFSAPWDVGADGGRSCVRESLGIPFEGHGATFTGIVVDVAYDHAKLPGSRMVTNERGFATSFPFSDTASVTRFNIVHADRRHAPQQEPVTEEEIRLCLREIYGFDIPFDRLLWGSRFTDTMRIVDRLREGRVLLVGEACRIHYPSSGVGMNFCLQDAFNLGWKLASVIKGHASADLLDSYEAERMPNMRNLLQSVSAQCALQFNFTAEGTALRRMLETQFLPLPDVNAHLAEDLNGLTVPYPVPAGAHRLVGRRAYDLDLITADGETRIGVLLRGGDWLLIDLTDSKVFDDAPFGDLPLRRISAVPTLVPDTVRGTRAMLVRPDGYVAWATDGPPKAESVRDVLRAWFHIEVS